MYLKCSVTFQQNTCILTFCMYFTRRDLFQTSPRYILDTHKIHHYTCILLASYASHWIHIRYIRIHLSWNLHRDTSRLQNYDKRHVYVRNTFRIHDGIHVSQMHAERHVSEMQDTCGIHVGYMYPERQSRYMLDTSTGIHARCMMRYMYMYLKCIHMTDR